MKTESKYKLGSLVRTADKKHNFLKVIKLIDLQVVLQKLFTVPQQLILKKTHLKVIRMFLMKTTEITTRKMRLYKSVYNCIESSNCLGSSQITDNNLFVSVRAYPKKLAGTSGSILKTNFTGCAEK